MKQIIFRADKTLKELIENYAAFNEIDKSKAIRELVKQGLTIKIYNYLERNWKKTVESRKENICDKCKKETNGQIYHINGNINDFTEENIMFICNKCVRDLNKSLRNYNIKERFFKWFFTD